MQDHDHAVCCSKDPRYIIEKDAVGRFTLTITVVEENDRAEWTAFITPDVTSKCRVSVEVSVAVSAEDEVLAHLLLWL